MYRFPRTKFVDINGIVGQILHIGDECQEALDSSQTPDIEHTMEEVMDCLHSCETALRIGQEKHGININDLAPQVEEKNRSRGYYS